MQEIHIHGSEDYLEVLKALLECHSAHLEISIILPIFFLLETDNLSLGAL